MGRRYIYICNVFEDSIKRDRSIKGDSPAASSKVINLCSAVRGAGGDAWIISLGRRRQGSSLKWYPATIFRTEHTPIVYVDFWDAPIMTHIITAMSLCISLFRLTKRDSVLVFYNCLPHYIPALVMNRLLGRRCILDLEDGFRSDDRTLRGVLNGLLLSFYSILCNGGAMLASNSLRRQTNLKPSYVCYGVAPSVYVNRDWTVSQLQVILGGSLFEDTGVGLFLDAMKLLMRNSPEVFSRLRFVVTGFGDYSEQLYKASKESMKDFLVFRGNVNSEEYRQILNESHIGLCLKLPESTMGATTFPSKVVELAAYGLLVVSTRVSDVPNLFGDDSAILLEKADPYTLVEVLKNIADRPALAREVAIKGQRRITTLLSDRKIGAELLRFWSGIKMSQETI